MTLPVLPVQDMANRHYGLTRALSDSYLEAARVCLDRHHEPPQSFTLQNSTYGSDEVLRVLVDWEPPNEQCRSAWANRDDATRDGAYACGIAAIELSLGLFAIARAETLTGADYYLARSNKPSEDLEDCFRLEVSGTHLDEQRVKSRLAEKVRQAHRGKSNLPALAVVVGFRVGLISTQSVEELL